MSSDIYLKLTTSSPNAEDVTDEIERLRGERKVLADLLAEALDVVMAIDPESDDEARILGRLVRDGAAAVTAVRAPSHTQSTGSAS